MKARWTGSEIEFDISGILLMVKALEKLDKSPQKAVTKAAREAIKPVLREIKSGTVPVGKTGNLRKAIIRKAERTKKRGKKVYEVTFNKAYNNLLQKEIQHPGLLGGKSEHAYYPASIEYGFLARAPGGGYLYSKRLKGSNQYREKRGMVYRLPSQKIEGQHYLQEGADNARAEAQEIMMKTLEEMLEKLIREASNK